jgi:hypothetical protein
MSAPKTGVEMKIQTTASATSTFELHFFVPHPPFFVVFGLKIGDFGCRMILQGLINPSLAPPIDRSVAFVYTSGA